MQEVLRQLSQQQNEQNKDYQQSPGQQLSSATSMHNTLIQKLNQMLAEKDDKIKELEGEIQMQSVKVKRKTFE